MVFKLQPCVDEPEKKSDKLGQNMLRRCIVNFLEDKETIGPLSIGLDGEWGSGKTSMLKTVVEDLKLDNNKDGKSENGHKTTTIPVFFEAWKYENSDPGIGLI